jgi:hypothetical protein
MVPDRKVGYQEKLLAKAQNGLIPAAFFLYI